MNAAESCAPPASGRAGIFSAGKTILLLALFGAAWRAEAAPAAPPNILFIMSDDHAAHAISAYGSRVNRTPGIDRVARAGMRFDLCLVNNSICTPSRAAILTGKYSHKNGVTVFNRFDSAQPQVQKYLRAAGYHTALIGKWHLFSDPVGFDYWNILPGQGLYFDPVMIENGKTNKLKGYVSDLITSNAIAQLAKRPAGKPFFLCVQPKAPHREWEPGPQYAKLYEDVEIPEPATFDDDYATRSPAAAEATMRIDRHLSRFDLKRKPPADLRGPELQKWRRTVDDELEVEVGGAMKKLTGQALKKWKYQKYMKDYLRCVASVDDCVATLLDYLDANGLRENTLVIYTSDQGFFLGDHGWYDKRFMYEECLRMPFVIRWPAVIRPGSVSPNMILNVDFAPTFLAAAGLPVPGDMQGRSFLPLLRGEPPRDWRASMYYRYYHYPGDHQVQPHYGVRTLRHKLIHFPLLDAWELFDLERDPRELNNVYNLPDQAPVIASLKTELARLRTELDDRDQFAAQPDSEGARRTLTPEEYRARQQGAKNPAAP